MRPRRTSSSTQTVAADGVTSEQYIRALGSRYGWDLGNCNVLFEGTTDVAHLELANDLYAASTNFSLIDDVFRVCAVGIGSEGGTDGMLDRVRLLGEALRVFPIDDPSRRIKVICVFDDDPAGRGAFSAMKKKFIPWNDIFLLRRLYPRSTRDPTEFEALTTRMNRVYLADKLFFCEIEDLISRSLIDAFVDATPGSTQRAIRTVGDAFHCDFNGNVKGRFVKFVKENALRQDVELLIELLKSLRFLFGLPEDGTLLTDVNSG